MRIILSDSTELINAQEREHQIDKNVIWALLKQFLISPKIGLIKKNKPNPLVDWGSTSDCVLDDTKSLVSLCYYNTGVAVGFEVFINTIHQHQIHHSSTSTSE